MATESIARLMVLLFTDIVGSVALKTRLGIAAYERMVFRHDEIFGDIVRAIPNGEIIKDTGDGFMVRFGTPSDAVTAALRFQHALAAESWDQEPLLVRLGIHVGEVSELGMDATGLPKLIGFAADIAARVMGLGLPGQLLMTRTSFDDARQYIRENPAIGDGPVPPLKWMAHGPYLFKGSDEPLDVFEVGGEGIAPLEPPPDSEKARRAVAAGDEATLGWRPAIGLGVPGRKGWDLTRKLGEGGFGEVWLANHRKTKNDRVFKFCFDADRLRSFKRELTLFRLLKDALGERKDIARLHEIQLDHSPYYLESEFTASGDLADWADGQGGIDKVPLSTRLDLVARTADAVAAAHSVGILHKDIKPSNILIYEGDDGAPRPRLSDFGIGIITDPSQLADRNITVAGFTETALGPDEASRTGTRIYAPPESLVGKPFTIQGDVYALGVMLYQMAVGELRRPLGTGWERDVEDEVLREDITRCVDRDPEKRLGSAAELGQRLRDLDDRRALRRRQARRTMVTRVGVGALASLAVLGAALTVHTARVTRERDRANQEAETSRQVSEFLEGLFKVSDPSEARGNSITAREILDRGSKKISLEMEGQPRIQGRLMNTMGWVYIRLGLYDQAGPLLERALELGRAELGDEHAAVATSMLGLGIHRRETGNYEGAQPLLEGALAIRERVLSPDDPALAESLNNLAILLAETADYKRARPMLERAIEIDNKALGPDHQDLARPLATLGHLLIGTGHYEEARSLCERALAIQEQVLGPDHPRVATTLTNLAITFLEAGDYDEARPLYERALRIREKILEPDHPLVAASLFNLGHVLHEKGDHEGARKLYERTLEIERKAFGRNHPDVAITLNNLADLLWRMGDYEGARLHYEQALKIDLDTSGPDHPDVAFDLDGLANVLLDMGDYDGARANFTKALAIREKALRSDHPDTAETLIGFARLLEVTGDYEEAVPLLERALKIQEATFGNDHTTVAQTLTVYAGLLRKTDRDSEARELEVRAEAIRLKGEG